MFLISCPLAYFGAGFMSVGETGIAGLAKVIYGFIIIWFALLLLGFILGRIAYIASGRHGYFVIPPLLNGALAATFVFFILAQMVYIFL